MRFRSNTRTSSQALIVKLASDQPRAAAEDRLGRPGGAAIRPRLMGKDRSVAAKLPERRRDPSRHSGFAGFAATSARVLRWNQRLGANERIRKFANTSVSSVSTAWRSS